MPDFEARDLPEDLVLPLDSGASWWYWSGGRPAIDLVNTHRERWRRGVETLVTPDDLATWFVRAGVWAPPPPVPPAVPGEGRELREAIDALVVAQTEDRPLPAAAVSLVDDWL